MKNRTQKQLPYNFDSLEPYIDSQTMEIHFTKHHQAYIDKLNHALNLTPGISDQPLIEILRNINSVPQEQQNAITNHGGGHINHSIFWEIMTPNKTPISKNFSEIISSNFGSIETFKEKFTQSALTRFGSGWAWLVKDPSNNKLKILSTPNQDSPLMQNKKPILGIDVWEHAYYLKYQNRRAEYIENWWNIVNWQMVEKLYEDFDATFKDL